MILFYFTPNSSHLLVYSLIALVIILIVTLVLYIDKRTYDKTTAVEEGGNDFFSNLGTEYVKDVDLELQNRVVENIKKNNINFSKNKFKNMSVDFLLAMFECWQNQNVNQLRKHVARKIPEFFEERLIYNIKNNLTTVVEDVTISQIYICDYNLENNFQNITVKIFFSFTFFRVDAEGTLVQGNPEKPKDIQCTLNFKLHSLIKDDPSVYYLPKTVCPSCNSILILDNEGYCDSCHLDIQGGYSHWIVDKITFDEKVEEKSYI